MRRPASRADWTGRSDAADGPAARRWHQVVRPAGAADAGPCLLGLACDAGVRRNLGRAGAAAGPGALRKALAPLAAHRLRSICDLGDVTCIGDALEPAQAEFGAVAAAALGAGATPIGLGGGHEIAFASWLGLRDALEARGDAEPVAIVNFDAHFDLRGDALPSSGTPFRQILEDAAARGRRAEYLCLGVSRYSNTAALFERARSLGVRHVLDEDLRADRFEALRAEIEALLGRAGHVYLTLCLDAFPAAVAPGVSAPAALGVDPAVVERLVDVVTASGKLRIADVAELNPQFDVDARTARLAARLVARIAEAIAPGVS